jgi:hypothetical protein
MMMLLSCTIGTTKVITPSGKAFIETLYPPSVRIDILQYGTAQPRVYHIFSYTAHVDEVIEIQLVTKQLNFNNEFFYVDVYDPSSATQQILGPIFFHTVAMTVEENFGQYPPHAQFAGTRGGNSESIQSMFKSLSFFKSFAKNVLVTRIASTTDNALTRIKWRITFVEAKFTSFQYHINTEKSFLDSTSDVTINTIVSPNYMSGTFSLRLGTRVTTEFRYDVSSKEMTTAINELFQSQYSGMITLTLY